MQGQVASGFLPYKINDEVIFKNEPESIIYRINNIRFIQYVKEQKAEFEILVSRRLKDFSVYYKLKEWLSSNKIKERIK